MATLPKKHRPWNSEMILDRYKELTGNKKEMSEAKDKAVKVIGDLVKDEADRIKNK